MEESEAKEQTKDLHLKTRTLVSLFFLQMFYFIFIPVFNFLMLAKYILKYILCIFFIRPLISLLSMKGKEKVKGRWIPDPESMWKYHQQSKLS